MIFDNKKESYMELELQREFPMKNVSLSLSHETL
jgi:hypothetical protein